jgi:hypothetical protein
MEHVPAATASESWIKKRGSIECRPQEEAGGGAKGSYRSDAEIYSCAAPPVNLDSPEYQDGAARGGLEFFFEQMDSR